MDSIWFFLPIALVSCGILGGFLYHARSRARRTDLELSRLYRVAQSEHKDRREAEEQLHRAQRMETVGQLVGGMAHETNNQMMVVLNFIEFVMRGDNLTAEQRADLVTVGEAAERVSALTRQVLSLSRRQVVDTRVLDLDSVVAEAESVLRRTRGAAIGLSLQLEPGEKWILADRNQLVQVMVNLALNARDAMRGTGELTISTRQSDRGPAGRRLGNAWPPAGVAL